MSNDDNDGGGGSAYDVVRMTASAIANDLTSPGASSSSASASAPAAVDMIYGGPHAQRVTNQWYTRYSYKLQLQYKGESSKHVPL